MRIRPTADYYYWALTLRLIESQEIELWATSVLSETDISHDSLIELSTSHGRDTESILSFLRQIPGQKDSAETFSLLMRLLARKYFSGEIGISYTMKLCEALHLEFSTPEEPLVELRQMCYRWEGVVYGFGEAEAPFLAAFDDFLRSFKEDRA